MRSTVGRLALLVVMAAMAFSALGGMAWAQEKGMTLEGLAEMVKALTARDVVIEERLAAVETRTAPTVTPTISVTPEAAAEPTNTPTPTTTPTPVGSAVYPRYDARQIFDDFEGNAARAEIKYLGKTIEVTGSILDIEKKGGSVFSGPERYEVTLRGEGFLRYLDCAFPLASEDEVLELNSDEVVTLRGYVFLANSVKVDMKECSVVRES